MAIKLLVFPLLMQLVAGRMNFQPKFYAQDSAIIVDTDKQLPTPMGMAPSPLRPYPMYHMLPPMMKAPPIDERTRKTLAEYPRDLLEIARTKLGIKRLEDIPSISKLTDMLGMSNNEDTIKYIRQMTGNDQGIALMRAYIESADYPEESRGDDEPEDVETTTTATTTTTTTSTTAKPQTANKPQYMFPTRIDALMHMYNIPPQHKAHLKQMASSAFGPQSRKPMMMQRHPLPYHYPIPLRPIGLLPQQPAHQMPPAHVHMSSPRGPGGQLLVQLAKFINIPHKKLEAFLQSKPKLANLANRISQIPMPHERNAAIDGQLIAAVKSMIEHDEDLKKLLSSTETLK